MLCINVLYSLIHVSFKGVCPKDVQGFCPGEAGLWVKEGVSGQLKEKGVEGSTVEGIEIERKFLKGNWNPKEETAGWIGPAQ